MTSAANPQPERPDDAPDTSSVSPLPVVDLDSSGPLPELPERIELPQSDALQLDRGPGNAGNGDANAAEDDVRRDALSSSPPSSSRFWFDGDVLMCACPDCRAPMSVRLWLMVADCWRCETSIELTEEQEREVRRMLERRGDTAHQDTAHQDTAHQDTAHQNAGIADSSGAPHGTSSTEPAGSSVIATAIGQPRVFHAPSAPPRAASATVAQRVGRRVRRQRQLDRGVSNWLNGLLKSMPAWLVSLLFHVILLTILGLLSRPDNEGASITLSTRVSPIVRKGGDTRIVAPSDESMFDLGVPDAIDLADPILKRAMVRADQDARELRLLDLTNPYLPELPRIQQSIQSPERRSLAARDPRVRVDMVREEGGTTLTEAAVARGLRWLADHQNSDGSWSLDRFHRAARCNCGQRGSISSDSAGTSLALLPFLGAGQTHLSGVYRDAVASGLRWLLKHQKANGDLRGSSRQYPGMYAHGQATIVLCEAFLMTGDEELRIPAQKAVDFIVDSQYPDGGWRYYPRLETRTMRGDTSVLGWQLMALQSALAADLSVPESSLENAGHFLDQVQRADGALYAYMSHEDHSAPMTAEALLCRIYLGWKQNHPALLAGISWMLENEPPDAKEPNIYYWYYATQAFHHYGGQSWERWNLQMRDVLVATQETRGHAAGSWTPDGPLTSQGGRIYMTALSICCLEVYYRHLPIFRQIDLK